MGNFVQLPHPEHGYAHTAKLSTKALILCNIKLSQIGDTSKILQSVRLAVVEAVAEVMAFRIIGRYNR